MKKLQEVKPAVINPRTSLSVARLLRVCVAFLAMAREYAAALERVGWDSKRTEASQSDLEQYEAARQERRQALAIAKLSTRVLHAELAEVRLLRAEVVAALRLVESVGIAVPPELLKGAGLRRHANAPKHLEWLSVARAAMVALAQPVSVHLQDPVGRVDERRERLLAALGNQEKAHRSLPLVTKQADDAKSRLAADVSAIRNAANIAFARNPSVLRQFRRKGLEAQGPRALPVAANDEPASVPDRSVAS